MNTTLISLIGGQALPNLLPALYLKPQRIVLVKTQQTNAVAEKIKPILEDNNIQVEELVVDAYDIAAVYQTLQDFIRQRQGEFIFNLTGGTKAMVLAANQVSLKHKSQFIYLESERNKSIIYYYYHTDGSEFKFDKKEPVPDLLTLDQFLDAHIGKNKWQENGTTDKDGGVFESAIANTLDKLFGSKLEQKQGVRFLGNEGLKRPQADLDIMIRFGNQFGRIECKNTAKAGLDALKQLNVVSELLGTYTKKLIALSRQANEDHKTIYEATKTSVIELTSYSDQHGLPPTDQETLKNIISKEFNIS